MQKTELNTLLTRAREYLDAGNLAEAKRVLSRSINQDDSCVKAWSMLGKIHAQENNSESARGCFERAIKIEPENLAANLELCRLHIASGSPDEALRHAEGAVSVITDSVELWMLLGSLCLQASMPEKAEQSFRQALGVDPSNADACNYLAAALLALNRIDEAENICKKALAIRPDHAETYANMGNIQSAQNRMDDAINSYTRATIINPGFAGAWMNLGNACKSSGNYAGAIDAYRRILQLNPKYVDIYNAIGQCYMLEYKYKDALECYQEAVRLAPDFIHAHMNMGYVYGETKEFERALECYKHVLEIDPKQVEACLCCGLVEKKLGLFPMAAESYRHALLLQPDNLDVQLSLSLVELLMGHYAEGWKYYAARKSVRNHSFDDPGVLDNDLSGQKILVIKDQGLGDEIFFLRYVKQLKRRNAWITYRTDPKIKTLVERLAFIDHIICDNEESPDYDLVVSAGDLPRYLGVDDSSPVASPVVISALPERINDVRRVLAAIGPGPYIGITWWAGTKHAGRPPDDRLAYRELSITLLAQTLRKMNGSVIVLQRNPEQADIDLLSECMDRKAYDLSRYNDDLEGMLALLGELDEYIGVDNTNMHLSLCAGKPCRILVPHPPEWRMQSTGSASPWFPGFTIYRQSVTGDWSKALDQLGNDLVAALSR